MENHHAGDDGQEEHLWQENIQADHDDRQKQFSDDNG